jgi:hypothetical protein
MESDGNEHVRTAKSRNKSPGLMQKYRAISGGKAQNNQSDDLDLIFEPGLFYRELAVTVTQVGIRDRTILIINIHFSSNQVASLHRSQLLDP